MSSYAVLREYIRRMMVDMNMQPGAGIIVVRKFSGTFKVLSLHRSDGIIDIPKGAIEENEFPLEAALRETVEESGVSQLDFKWGFDHAVNGDLTCYVAETSQDPFITKNPETGIMEHVAATWEDWDTITNNTLEYIIPCIEWARTVVEPES